MNLEILSPRECQSTIVTLLCIIVNILTQLYFNMQYSYIKLPNIIKILCKERFTIFSIDIF